MHAGVLIIGSLFWDIKPHRIEWRRKYLNMDVKIKVTVPISYGRCSRSRGNTYTMTFRKDENMGQSVFIPFISPIKTRNDLITMASALWDAEQSRAATTKTIGASWGIIGALFKSKSQLSKDWTDYFHSQVREKGINLAPMSYVDEKGFLRIPWPKLTDESTNLDMDIIFATVTKPERTPPDYNRIANAWLRQNDGYEEYFFRNVISGKIGRASCRERV